MAKAETQSNGFWIKLVASTAVLLLIATVTTGASIIHSAGARDEKIKSNTAGVAENKAACYSVNSIDTRLAVIESQMRTANGALKGINDAMKGRPDTWHMRAKDRADKDRLVEGD